MLINLGCRGGVCRKVPTRRTSNLHELLTLRLLQHLDVAHTQVCIQHQPFCPHNSPQKKLRTPRRREGVDLSVTGPGAPHERPLCNQSPQQRHNSAAVEAQARRCSQGVSSSRGRAGWLRLPSLGAAVAPTACGAELGCKARGLQPGLPGSTELPQQHSCLAWLLCES